MFDSINADAPYVAPPKVLKRANAPVVYNGRLYLPNRGAGNDLWIKSYTHQEGKFQFILEPERVFIQNSIHKLIHNNNFSDFPYSDIVKAIGLIEDVTNIDASSFTMRGQEVGLNIEIGQRVDIFLKSILDYKNKEFRPLIKNGRIYGRKAFLTDFSIKFYDKGLETSLRERCPVPFDNLVRFELAYRRNRALGQINTLADLADKDKVYAQGCNLISILESISFDSRREFSGCSDEQVRLFFACCNADYLGEMKGRIGKEPYKYIQRQYRDLKERVYTGNMKDMFIRSVRDKLDYLLSN